MQDNVIWASEAPEANIAAPSSDKQAQGWTKETPPFEWFNWHMNRTDKRLVNLEARLEWYAQKIDQLALENMQLRQSIGSSASIGQ